MKHFLSILLRNQFNLFYRFGYTYIPKCQLLEFDGVINESTKEDLIRLFSETTPFEWEEEYLIVHFDKSEVFEGQVINFQIQDIVKVYPLSAQAKSSIETKIDQRIRLEKPVFENILPNVEKTIEKHELEKAIQALWNICDIEDDLNKYISNIGLDNIFNGLERRKIGTKPHQIKEGNYWEYVLTYDRFDYFPNSILGYFYDAGQIFANTKGLPSFEGSALHKFLQDINSSKPEIRIKEIVKLLETEGQGKKYVSQTTSNEQLQYLITPLYLMLKDEIRKAEDIKSTNLFKHLKTLKEFGASFNYAIILLGAFFGFKKFYDAYYDNLNLRFYKSYQPVKDKKEEPEKIVSKNQTESNEPTSSKEEPVSDENQGLEDRPKSEEHTIASDLQELKVEPVIQDQPLNDQQTSEDITASTEPIVTEVVTKPEEQKIGINDNNDSESKENIESKKGDEILPTDDIKSEVSENPIEHLKKSNSDTETVIRLKNIINELLTDKTEMKLTDMGNKIKEVTGQKITNTIIKNVIKSMDNVEIVPKKKPETARKIIMQDLFNKQV
ncbi:hypothetical protein J0A68_08230 [Algoriphagus sp. H41]|uniref:Uncharacterized protein n=1 Tax=Algoriphagus oliviformis TaxID=2811231 RepID=A0ABS3C1E4_9BACT|nr:hypothetical protein [Algoriphagus oliviformis]MBN7810938.1 hypothetical protein [Algoriphagus oliviformis]